MSAAPRAPVTRRSVAASRWRRTRGSAHPRLRRSTRSVPTSASLGVLLGSIMSTLGSRITTFGLADLRGGLHAGFDEGAWITTSFGIGQMLIGVASPYLGAIFGVRRVLLLGIVLLFIASLLGAAVAQPDGVPGDAVPGGVGSGTFIPLTISFIVRNLPARLVIYGIAVYAMNSELSQNVAASLEGWYSDNWSWRWIDWQYCAAAAADVRLHLVRRAAREDQHDAAAQPRLARPGLCAMLGFGLLYAGLDQGNRLDWVEQRPGQRPAAGRRRC